MDGNNTHLTRTQYDTPRHSRRNVRHAWRLDSWHDCSDLNRHHPLALTSNH